MPLAAGVEEEGLTGKRATSWEVGAMVQVQVLMGNLAQHSRKDVCAQWSSPLRGPLTKGLGGLGLTSTWCQWDSVRWVTSIASLMGGSVMGKTSEERYKRENKASYVRHSIWAPGPCDLLFTWAWLIKQEGWVSGFISHERLGSAVATNTPKSQKHPRKSWFFSQQGGVLTHPSHSGAQADEKTTILNAAALPREKEKETLERVNQQLNGTHWPELAPSKYQGHKAQLGQQKRGTRCQGTTNVCHSWSLRPLPALTVCILVCAPDFGSMYQANISLILTYVFVGHYARFFTCIISSAIHNVSHLIFTMPLWSGHCSGPTRWVNWGTETLNNSPSGEKLGFWTQALCLQRCWFKPYLSVLPIFISL